MGLAVGLGLLFLILAALIAGIVLAVKRWGLRRVSVYASYGIAGRLIWSALDGQDVGEKVLRAMGAVLLLLWPHVMERRAYEKEAIRRRETIITEPQAEQEEPEYMAELRKSALRD